ncbi:MAG: DJ-1/PfpI family protein [Ruminococcaceae bacterium]|nr:DJ-1/PfpI family protein [Oscillospiraceae bacterium]
MVYMFLADGFEEVEALCPLDLLRRAGVSVMTVGVGEKVVRGSHGIEVIADITTAEAEKLLAKSPAEMVILPGGMPGSLNLQKDAVVNAFIDHAAANNAYLAAICAAPLILGERDLLVGREAICYPGFEDKLHGAKISDKKVAQDGKFITGKGMGVALEFGLKLVEVLVSKEKADELFAAVQA